jgi:hypothetical protein
LPRLTTKPFDFVFRFIFSSTLKGNIMRISTLALALSLSIAGAAYAGGKHDHSPKHGGIVVEAKDMDYEVVAKPDMIQIYVSDHGKPIKIVGGRAKVTLLNGSEKTDVELVPAGEKLEAKGAFKVAKGTKGVATVTLGSKTSSVRFEIK